MTKTRKFAADDANLNVGAIITSRQQKYVDLDLDFTINPNTKDVGKKRDANAVKESVKNIIQTDYFERPYQPFIGSGIRELLFELADDVTDVLLKDRIVTAINNFEPRAKVINVVVKSDPDSNYINATLQFRVVSTQEQVTLNFSLERLR